MTANNTPRLGLMAPVDADPFQSSDFNQTFNKLDGTPGVTIVSNYASLTSLGWGLNQHGSKVIQTDTGAEWMWNNPSGSGTWIRTNSVGILINTSMSAPISTTAIDSSAPVFIDSGNFVIPGGRPVLVHLNMGMDNSSGIGGLVIVSLNDTTGQLTENNYRPGLPTNFGGTQENFFYYITNATNASTHRLTAKFRSAALSPAVGGGGKSIMRRAQLVVREL